MGVAWVAEGGNLSTHKSATSKSLLSNPVRTLGVSTPAIYKEDLYPTIYPSGVAIKDIPNIRSTDHLKTPFWNLRRNRLDIVRILVKLCAWAICHNLSRDWWLQWRKDRHKRKTAKQYWALNPEAMPHQRQVGYMKFIS